MEFLHTVRDTEALPATRALLPSYFTPFFFYRSFYSCAMYVLVAAHQLLLLLFLDGIIRCSSQRYLNFCRQKLKHIHCMKSQKSLKHLVWVSCIIQSQNQVENWNPQIIAIIAISPNNKGGGHVKILKRLSLSAEFWINFLWLAYLSRQLSQ